MILSIIAIALLVFIHELGHYWVGRLNGIGAKSFSIGFGPTILSLRDGRGTDWKISLIPLGGYVEYLNSIDEVYLKQLDYDNATDEERVYYDRIAQIKGSAFDRASLSARLQAIVAGPMVNLLAVIPLALLVVVLQQAPVKTLEVSGFNKTAIAEIVDGHDLEITPEYSAGDEIIKVGDIEVLGQDTAKNMIVLALYRGEKIVDITVKRRYASEHTYSMSPWLAYQTIVAAEFKDTTSLSSAFRVELDHIWTSTTQNIMSLPSIISHMIAGSDDALDATDKINQMISSPVMIVKQQADILAEMGTFREMLVRIVSDMASFTLMLGFLNLLPLAFLDGGQLVVNCIEHLKERFNIDNRAFNLGMNLYGVASVVLVIGCFGFAILGDIYELVI